MRRSTLGGRIFATIGITLAALLGMAALYGESRIRSFHHEELERRLQNAAVLLEDRARGALDGTLPPESLRETVRDLRLEGGLRITVIADDGAVLADSHARLPLENHGGRPEVLRARESGSGEDTRVSESVGFRTLYHARRIRDGDRVLGFVRTGASLARAEEEIASLRRTLLVGGLFVLALGLTVSALVSRWLARPLEEMERAAAAFAAGDLEAPIRTEGPREVTRLAGSLNRMADDLRRRIEAERGARGELEAVLSGMVEGVVAVDGAERVVLMNRAAARLLGLPGPLEAGGHLWEAVRFPDLEFALREVLAGRDPERADADSPGSDGRVLEISAAPLGARSGAVALLREVTEVRRLERIRMDFVANVSHELRTPLAALTGALETLEDPGEDPGARERFLGIARRNASRLQSLVSDLLDLSSIEAEGSRMPLEPLPLDRPLRAAVNALIRVARDRKVELSLERLPPGDLAVAGNGRRLEQCFLNLVENALKYTPEGGRVTVRVADRGAELSAEVEDTGVGIPAASLPRIFERFYRVDASRSREMGGTGLGLAIVKHVVRAHRGRVEVNSQEGRGSLFSVVLPRAVPAEG